MHLLVTRPEPDAQRTASALRQRGHAVIIAPMLRIEAVPADLGSDPWDALVMTSANSCRAAASHSRRDELALKPVFVVGRHTAEAARMAGFANVTSADADAKELAKLLAAQFDTRDRRLLYLAGEDRTADLAADLAAEGIVMKTVVIYRAVKVTNFPTAARDAIAGGKLEGILHFSRRSAEAYLSCAVGAAILDRAVAPFHYCLSPQVARPLLQVGAATVRVAARPDEAALLDLIGPAG
jgi:uroporphyrinogen-III synthase